MVDSYESMLTYRTFPPLPTTTIGSFHPEAADRVAGLQADRARFRGLAAEVEGHVQELASLAAFYSHFAVAYAALGPEAARRRAYLGRVARVAQEAQQRLEALRAEEEAERARFRAEHGRYLPASLCPVIQEAPERFAVRPNVEVRVLACVLGRAWVANGYPVLYTDSNPCTGRAGEAAPRRHLGRYGVLIGLVHPPAVVLVCRACRWYWWPTPETRGLGRPAAVGAGGPRGQWGWRWEQQPAHCHRSMMIGIIGIIVVVLLCIVRIVKTM